MQRNLLIALAAMASLVFLLDSIGGTAEDNRRRRALKDAVKITGSGAGLLLLL